MKHSLISIIPSLLFSTFLLGCNYENPRVNPPVYTNSKMVLNTISVIHDGNKVQLKIYDYYNFDIDKAILKEVNILYNEKSKPWLLFYVIFDTHHSFVNSRIDLFEYRDNKWNYVVTIGNLNNSSLTDSINNFVKEKYKLEFKQ